MHVALIPDGNRRFMKKHGILQLEESYQMGISRFYDFLEWCNELGVKEVTIYALSLENIQNRSANEIETLLKVFSAQAKLALSDKRIHKNKVRVNVCGDKSVLNRIGGPLGKELVENLRKLEESTKDYDEVILNLAIAYGGRQEILNAAKEVLESGLDLTEENIKKKLWVKDYPDVIIRTAEDRLSNFLLWQSAYSEIYFSDKLWQEFTKKDLASVLSDYRSKERRFGR